MVMCKVCLHLFICIVPCSCLVKLLTFQANKPCDANIELSLDGETETTAKSAIECAVTCFEQTGSRGFLFYKETKACHAVNAESPMFDACAPSGATFYKYKRDCTIKVITGGHTASSALNHWAAGPVRARPHEYGGWVPNTVNSAQYLQINFMKMKTIVSITTFGSHYWKRCVVSYKLLGSSDCLVFDELTDEAGNAKIFSGSTNIYHHVTNDVIPNMKVRCVRINPVTWSSTGIAIKLYIRGC